MEIVLAIIGSGALSALIAGVFQLINNGKEKADKRFIKLEKDILRTQLLLMLDDFPDETSEILKLAQHYFVDLEGDWYLTSMFNKWLEEKKIAKPEWFQAVR